MKTRLILIPLALLILFGMTIGASAQEPEFTAEGACITFHDDLLLTQSGLFDVAAQTQIVALEAASSNAQFSPTGQWLVLDQQIMDTQSGAVVFEMDYPGSVAFSLDDR